MKMKLYKYIKLETEEDFVRLENYLNQDVWLSPFSDVNDEFEGCFNLVPLTSQTVLSNQELFDKMLLLHQHDEPGLNKEEFKVRLESKEFQDALSSSRKLQQLYHSHGVLCFTQAPDDLQMWNKYGDSHRGCCIEFELDFHVIQNQAKISKENIYDFIHNVTNNHLPISFHMPGVTFEFIFVRVKYADEFPILHWDELLHLSKPIDQILYIVPRSIGVKLKKWSNEKEFRLIVNTNSTISGLLPLKRFVPFIRVTGIIIGSETPENIQKKMAEKATSREISLMKAIYSNSKITIHQCNPLYNKYANA